MITLETQANRIRILPDGQINVLLNCCAVDSLDGTVTVMDSIRVEITPINDIEATLALANTALADKGFTSIPSDVTKMAGDICLVEHTPEAKIRCQVAAAKVEKAAILSGSIQAAEGRLDSLSAYIDANTSTPESGIKKETCLSLVDVLPDGQMEIRLRKCIVVDGETVGVPAYHRLTLSPMSNVQATLDLNAKAILAMGAGDCVVEDIERIKRICACCYSGHCVAKFKVEHWSRYVANLSGDSSEKLDMIRADARLNLEAAEAELASAG